MISPCSSAATALTAQNSILILQYRPVPYSKPDGKLAPYGLLDANITFRDIGGVDVDLFAKNITDELYKVSNANGYARRLTGRLAKEAGTL